MEVNFIIFVIIIGCVGAQSTANSSIELERFPGEFCYRSCDKGSPRICYFQWHLEHYHVLGPACGSCGLMRSNVSDCFNDQCITADGVERGVMSINRKIPGPSMHVCKDDLIVVDVTNAMGGTSASIHWHGFHQRDTPWMDGVPFITQCPIDFATTFRYSFRATEAGTQFYHSHSGHHKVNGVYGGIVVRRPMIEDANIRSYDRDLPEHLMVVSDWMEDLGEMFMPGLRSHSIGIQPTNLLINGKGTKHDKKTGRSITGVPLEVFRVQRGQRFRFRFVNSMSHVCPAVLEIENHSLLIIASDSYDLRPVTVDSLVSTSGERYDFVVNANATGGEFWIRLRVIGKCASRQLEQFAVLSYAPVSVTSESLAFPRQKFPEYSKEFGNGNHLNHPNTTCGLSRNKSYCITDLSSYIDRPDITEGLPDYKFYLGFKNHRQNNEDVFGNNKHGHFMNTGGDHIAVGAINNISFMFPPFSPLTQPDKVKEFEFCDEDNIPEKCKNERLCHCVHRLIVKKDAIVELVIVDETDSVNSVNHPFHLHGYQLFVMGMGQHYDNTPMTVATAKKLVLMRRFFKVTAKHYVIKDTISIPSKGFTIFRFKADNPGWWLLHCHFEWHMAVGMGLVLQVGDPSDMVPPPENFPKCGNYKPNIDFNIFSNKL